MSSIKNTEMEGSLSVGRNLTAGGGATIQGNVTIARNLNVGGWLEAKNIKGPGKGLFTSVESLKEAYPHPHEGWWALVGSTLPAELYVAEAGEWVDTGETAGEVTVDSQAYEEQVEALNSDLESLASDVETNTDSIASLQSALASETAARESADASLQSALASETTARESADASLQSALASETTARESADSSLQEEVETLESRFSDTYQEITDARIGTDGTIYTNVGEAIRTQVSGVASDVDDLNAVVIDLHATVSLEASKTVIEKGVDTSVTFKGTASFNGSTDLVTEMSLYQTTSASGTSVASSATSPLTYTATLSDTMTYTLLATIGGLGKTATRTVNAYYPIYLLASADDPTSSAVTGGTKQSISSTAAGTYSITTSDGDYVWLCVPDGVTVPTSATMSGFDCPVTNEGTVSGVSVNGASVTYTLVRTTNAMKADTLTITYS